MKILTTIFERLPGLWFLLGLLFNAAGLYIGFDFSISFAYMIIGWFCCAYGVALFIFRIIERPKTNDTTRLSRNFISVGSPLMMSGEKDRSPARPSRDGNEER